MWLVCMSGVLSVDKWINV